MKKLVRTYGSYLDELDITYEDPEEQAFKPHNKYQVWTDDMPSPDNEYGNYKYNTDSPAEAIEDWFRVNQKCPMETTIYMWDKNDAIALIDYAYDHMDWVLDLADQYNCQIKKEYLEKWIISERDRKCSGFLGKVDGFPDSVSPFSFG